MFRKLTYKLKDWSGYHWFHYMRHMGMYGDHRFWSFYYSIKGWLHLRPRRVKCSFCRDPFWWYGELPENVYCSENCAYYGPLSQECGVCGRLESDGDHVDCIPF